MDGAAFGPLFGLIWDTASDIKMDGLSVPDAITAFHGINTSTHIEAAGKLRDYARTLPSYEIEDSIAQETFETAEILAKAYVKAFAELDVAAKQPERIAIRHHSALLAEIIGDMLNLVLQGGERTDLRLPDTHLHKKISLQQERVRVPRSS